MKVHTPLTKLKVIFLFPQSTVILNYLPTLQGGINNTLSLFMNRLKKNHMQVLLIIKNTTIAGIFRVYYKCTILRIINTSKITPFI